MGILKSITDSVEGVFADQWKDIITAPDFDEHVAVAPGIKKAKNNGRGNNLNGSDGIISNGSKVYIPENTAAIIFSQDGLESIITNPGGYEYLDGEGSVFDGDGIGTIFKQIGERIGYGGIPEQQKKIAYVNLREIRNIKFGTRGPQLYHDGFYDVDLEIIAFGSLVVRVTDPQRFVQNFLPANTMFYSFDDEKVRGQLISEFLHSFVNALNSLSDKYRVSQLPAQTQEITEKILTNSEGIGNWDDRFGLRLVHINIENIELTEESSEIVRTYAERKVSVSAYEDVSQKASNIAAQQKIASGIEENGLGDAGGMLLGMNMAQGISPSGNMFSEHNLDEQIENVRKLKALVDEGILTEEEFEKKKKEIMGV